MDKILKDYMTGKITYEEYVKQFCNSYVGEDNFDFYDLQEHDLYIYCKDGNVEIVSNFY